MEPTYNFDGQVAVVTGGSSGMGLATAHAFAESGAAVALVDIDSEALRTATDRLTAAGHATIGITCDVSDEGQVATMMATVLERFGRVDLAFNNAGIQVPPTDAADEEADAFDRVTRVNLRGVWACMKHELRHMRTRGSGAIVNNSSLGGLVGQPMRAAYHSSKHGVIGLTKVICNEYAARGIRCNAIAPGIIDTPLTHDTLVIPAWEAQLKGMIPAGRIGKPDDVADVAVWLCTDAARYVNGHVVAVDGGILVR